MEIKFGLIEMKRIIVIEKLISGFSSVQEAADELELSKRQVLRIKKKYLINQEDSIPHLTFF